MGQTRLLETWRLFVPSMLTRGCPAQELKTRLVTRGREWIEAREPSEAVKAEDKNNYMQMPTRRQGWARCDLMSGCRDTELNNHVNAAGRCVGCTNLCIM